MKSILSTKEAPAHSVYNNNICPYWTPYKNKKQSTFAPEKEQLCPSKNDFFTSLPIELQPIRKTVTKTFIPIFRKQQY